MRKELTLAAIAAIAGTLAIIGLVDEAHAAGYLKFDGVDGEATDKDHKNWSDILSFEQSITRGDSSSASTRARGSAVFHDIVITKELDASSPKLAESIAKGMVYPSVEFHLTAGSGTYLKYELKNVMITSYSVGGSADEKPTEQISLNFEEIKMTYTAAGETGTSKGNVEYSWKIEAGVS